MTGMYTSPSFHTPIIVDLLHMAIERQIKTHKLTLTISMNYEKEVTVTMNHARQTYLTIIQYTKYSGSILIIVSCYLQDMKHFLLKVVIS